MKDEQLLALLLLVLLDRVQASSDSLATYRNIFRMSVLKHNLLRRVNEFLEGVDCAISVLSLAQTAITNKRLVRTLDKLAITHKRLARTLDRLAVTNEHLARTLDKLAITNKRLARTLDKLAVTNERLARTLDRLLFPRSTVKGGFL